MINTFTLVVNYTDSRGHLVRKRFDNLSRVGIDTFMEYYFNKAKYADLSYEVEKYNGDH